MTTTQKLYVSQLKEAEREALDIDAAEDAALIRAIFSNAHALDTEMFTGGESDLLGRLLYEGVY